MAGCQLVIHSSIHLDTNDGRRDIHLCFGDITSTATQRCMDVVPEDGTSESTAPSAGEPEDVILISAFQGQ